MIQLSPENLISWPDTGVIAAPELFTWYVYGYLVPFRLSLQQFIERFLCAAPNQIFELPLDHILIGCTIVSGTVCSLLSEWCVETSLCLGAANHVSCSLFFTLRNILDMTGIQRHSKRPPTKVGGLLLWSECNYRTWKNPVISMVCKQQARGFIC